MPVGINSTKTVLRIVLAHGPREPIMVLILSVSIGILQILGVASLFPFLSVATDPDSFRASTVGLFFEGVLPRQDKTLILSAGIVFLTVAIINTIVTVYGNYRITRFVWDFLHKLRTSVLASLMNREIDYFESRDSSSLLKHLEADCVFFSLYVVGPSLNIVSKLILITGLTLILININFNAVVIILTVLFLLYSTVFLVVKRRLAPDISQRNYHFEELYLTIAELLKSIKYVMLHKSDNYWIQRFQTVSEKISAVEPRVQLISAIPRHFIEIIGYVLLVAYLNFQLLSGNSIADILPLLGFLAFAVYRLLPACQEIYSSLNRINNYSYTIPLVASSLENECDNHPQHNELIHAPEHADKNNVHSLVCDNVCYGHTGRALQLSEANLSIMPGKRIAIIGSTGAGKSTLLDLLLGYKFPSKGKILFNGEPLTRKNRDQLRSVVGYVGQKTTLLNTSVLENVVFSDLATNASDQAAAVAYACTLAQLHEFIVTELPDGYNTVIGESGIFLSGGQQQRLGIARALYRKPKILVLDEATNALDESTESHLLDRVFHSLPDVSIISVTHRSKILDDFDDVYELKHGKITRVGGK